MICLNIFLFINELKSDKMFKTKKEARDYAEKKGYIILGETDISIEVLDRSMNKGTLAIVGPIKKYKSRL